MHLCIVQPLALPCQAIIEFMKMVVRLKLADKYEEEPS